MSVNNNRSISEKKNSKNEKIRLAIGASMLVFFAFFVAFINIYAHMLTT
jgi:hypothetical protein